MKKIFHKNQVIITTLAFLIAVAGYISYDRVNTGKNQEAKKTNVDMEDSQLWETMTSDISEGTEVAEMVSDTQEIVNPGESVLTSVAVSNANYAAEVKLNREQIRSKNKEALLSIIDNKDIADEQKQKAVDEMVTLTDIAEKEANTEMMLEAKGFTNVVVSISDEACDVVLNMGDVTDAKRAQVEDIVKRKTGIEADKIVITPIQ